MGDEIPQSVLNATAASLTGAEKQGTLHRRTRILRQWKPRWVVLHGKYLYWFPTAQSEAPEEVISLKSATGVRREETGTFRYSFVINRGTNVEVFGSDDSEEMESWLRALGRAIVRATTAEWDDTSDRIDEQQH